METWRDRARAKMKEIGLTQEKLSVEFDMTAAGIQKWLAGTRHPSLEEINLIADKLGVTQTWLVHGLEPSDTVDGLAHDRQSVLRNLIRLERSQPMPDTFWEAVSAMAAAVSSKTPPTAVKSSSASSRNGTDG
ncbi:MAG: helix-turn-helix transcriptional regulator [Hydrogenophaga sp.]|nr:helix-turn-helix transcriptional regulator [Hydrogenophaga sp.]